MWDWKLSESHESQGATALNCRHNKYFRAMILHVKTSLQETQSRSTQKSKEALSENAITVLLPFPLLCDICKELTTIEYVYHIAHQPTPAAADWWLIIWRTCPHKSLDECPTFAACRPHSSQSNTKSKNSIKVMIDWCEKGWKRMHNCYAIAGE